LSEINFKLYPSAQTQFQINIFFAS